MKRNPQGKARGQHVEPWMQQCDWRRVDARAMAWCRWCREMLKPLDRLVRAK